VDFLIKNWDKTLFWFRFAALNAGNDSKDGIS